MAWHTGPYNLAPTYLSSPESYFSLMLDTLKQNDSPFFTASPPHSPPLVLVHEFLSPSSSLKAGIRHAPCSARSFLCPAHLCAEGMPLSGSSCRPCVSITARPPHFLTDSFTHPSPNKNVNPRVTAHWTFHISSIRRLQCRGYRVRLISPVLGTKSVNVCEAECYPMSPEPHIFFILPNHTPLSPLQSHFSRRHQGLPLD